MEEVTEPKADRDERGRFVAGNTFGLGSKNPVHSATQRFTNLLAKCVTKEDFRVIVNCLVMRAKAGNRSALRILYDRLKVKSKLWTQADIRGMSFEDLVNVLVDKR